MLIAILSGLIGLIPGWKVGKLAINKKEHWGDYFLNGSIAVLFGSMFFFFSNMIIITIKYF